MLVPFAQIGMISGGVGFSPQRRLQPASWFRMIATIRPTSQARVILEDALHWVPHLRQPAQAPPPGSRSPYGTMPSASPRRVWREAHSERELIALVSTQPGTLEMRE